ncbi:TIGR03790 family protein [Paucibacter sp. Y2R2-4]|uniref:TIGR03790 family protein n=1 Tax=Paucibacter sp. Y2R2-4 TaxID=2893553 RepID=UPI0021E51621|nr:TIGR03790 family protein [Paucibacter sp. Y2R2-4]MCV2351629.1 TIGR03790 family protein [Paucibacter sp. Y2R2-4]
MITATRWLSSQLYRPARRSLGGQSLLLAFLLALSACGGGGGSASSPAASTPTPNPTPVGSATSTFGLSLPRAGLSAQDLGIIVAEGDALSEAMAAYYQAARGVPAANIIRVKLNTSAETIAASDFTALKAEVDAKLPAGVQATLLTWASPARVVGSCTMSITSALAFGYDAKYCGGCSGTSPSPYYDTESNKPWTDHKFRPSMMLGARTLEAARSLIDRGVRADASQPSGSGYLLRTSDAARSVRYGDYTGLPANWAGRLQLSYIDNSAGAASDAIVGKTDVLFYFTGKAVVPSLSSNSFLPGAVADHLTSFAGVLPSGWGQMPATDWLDAGATASYGTVEEPCNYLQKFSQASVLIEHYYRGDTVLEAYWKSVQWPGQGLFVGEPLAQPFKDNASFTLEGSQYLIKTRALRPNSNYSLEFRTGPTATWTSLANFQIKRAELQTLSAPLPPATATQLRWRGPCPNNNSLQCTLSESP